MSDLCKPLSELFAELEKANESLNAARERSRIANGDQCVAMNRVNDLQKQVDARMAELAKAAPRDSDWSRRARSR